MSGTFKDYELVISQSFEAKKESTLKEKQADLKKKLAKAESDDEKAKIMQEFVDNVSFSVSPGFGGFHKELTWLILVLSRVSTSYLS